MTNKDFESVHTDTLLVVCSQERLEYCIDKGMKATELSPEDMEFGDTDDLSG